MTSGEDNVKLGSDNVNIISDETTRRVANL